jgi:hypothetical protein
MGSGIYLEVKGDFSKTYKSLKDLSLFSTYKLMGILEKYGEEGVRALQSTTPKDSGLTASSWSYDIEVEKDLITISWNNSNINDGVPIAVLIQYGHGTGTGGYVEGVDYINPAMHPIFKQIADSAWKEVRGL